jgi:Protein of unknown function (DUF3631)
VRLASILAERDDRPWAESGRSKKPITPRGIASLLEPFKIRPKETAHGKMGYREKQFAHAFRRYLSSDIQKNAEIQDIAGDSTLGSKKTNPRIKNRRRA